jgi:hypothetical protein
MHVGSRAMLAALAVTAVLAGATTVCAATPAAAPSVTKPAPAPRLPGLSADQIAEKSIAAMGGASAWRAVHAMTLSGKLDAGRERKDGGYIPTSPSEAKQLHRVIGTQILEGKYKPPAENVIQLPFKLELERPYKQRLEIPFQGQTALQVYDGTSGWKVRPFMGRHEVESYSSEEMRIAAGEEQLDGPLVDYSAKGTKISLVGTDMVEGHPAYKLKLRLRDGSERGIWIDGQSFLVVKMEGAPRRRDGHARTAVTYLRDYRREQGLMIPFTRETQVEGDPHTQRIQVETVAFNPSYPTGNFSRPD